jgi:hypothetical protein
MGEETRAGRPKRSRRELLAGAAGAAGVIAAQTVVGAKPAYATDPNDVVLGVDNQSTSGTTGVSSSDITGLHGRTTASNATGVFGEALSDDGTGVHGVGSLFGVRGDGPFGIDGESTIAGGVGVVGSASGVGGRGVHGAGSERGVNGTSDNIGVYGQGGLVGLYGASAAPGGTGVGLRVYGRSVFRTAGVATVPSGAKKVTVNLAGVTSTDMVLATVQQNGAFFVKNAVAASGKFTIYLNKAPTSPTTVILAWFVISAS